jgi:molybdopterin-guanine dinucleotide biosynthesis protein A
MSAPTRAEITGLVLAGGRGSRMGGLDKGLVEYEGRPLVDWVAERLAPQVLCVLVSANRNVQRYEHVGQVVRDRADDGPFAGPLAGILAALRAAPTPWLAVAPCDTPRLPADGVMRLADGLAGARASFAVTAEREHPLVCLLHASLADEVDQALRSGERRAGRWLRQVGARPVHFDSPADFANLNRLQDLATAVPTGPRSP